MGLVAEAATHTAGHSDQNYPPRQGATPILIVAPTTPPGRAAPAGGSAAVPGRSSAAPTLTTAEQVEVLRVALADRYVLQLVHGKRYRVAAAQVWVGTHGKLQGGMTRLIFVRPHRIAGVWLRMRRVPYRTTYSKVKALRVYVDLGRKQVVAITPRRVSA